MEVISGAALETNINNKSDEESSLIKSPPNEEQNSQSVENNDSSDEENFTSKSNVKRRRLSDSDSSQSDKKLPNTSLAQTFSSDEEKIRSSSTRQRSKIHHLSSGSDSDVKLPDITQSKKLESRTESKQKKLKNKFKQLLKSNKNDHISKKSDESNSADSDNDLNSVEKIKQIIKERNQHLKSTLYDPDTSDEETNHQQRENLPMMKKQRKSTKLISPKPMKMTAKDAMENMQKIKSESNRMLREKEVSLPYHRPKALSLKDIMSKRRPAISADGKALPIKMNDEQLKHYVKILEEKQKEVIQLCKSDTEDEDEERQENNIIPNNDNNEDTDKVTDVNEESETVNKTLEVTSDDLYDDLKSNLEVTTSSESKQDNKTNAINNDTEVGSHNTEIILDETKKDEVFSEIMNTKVNSEQDSQLMHLHYTENTEEVIDDSANSHDDNPKVNCVCNDTDIGKEKEVIELTNEDDNKQKNEFYDFDMDMEYIDALIQNAEKKDKDTLAISVNPMNVKPKLTGTPGTVIDLDNIDDVGPKNLSGVELLKERYIFFSKLKTPEEIEREKEKRVKPGTLHLKLKQELEEKMAEQRSLEWSKRLEEEKAQQMETDVADEEDDIEKLEAKLEEEAEVVPDNAEELESEEELVEDDCNIEDKPRKRNPMLDDEADVSDDDRAPLGENDEQSEQDDKDVEDDADDESEESSDESSESENEREQNKPKKGRILKAFEDSDEEEIPKEVVPNDDKEGLRDDKEHNCSILQSKNSQDEDLQLAQIQRSYSEDLFPSQGSGKTNTEIDSSKAQNESKIDNTQSFSIMETNTKDINDFDNFTMTCDSQEDKIEPAVAELLCNLPQNLEPSQQPTQTQGFGDDVLALCTGNFYDNQFISQTDQENHNPDDSIQDIDNTDKGTLTEVTETQNETMPKQKIESCDILKSILTELDSPEFEKSKPNKFFADITENNVLGSNPIKKRFVIDSDDEVDEIVEAKKSKKKKRKRMENRALQISDDEEDEDCEDEGEYESELDEDNDAQIVEYDSEENEVITSNPIKPKKKTVTDFFEDEAELSSNEEWSGDEDERGLDRMEREDGDQDHFHQGKLQKELGIIHMREVLDQDKREVRMIQELLFEDGDLGDGHRQRRFRWRNIDGEEVDINTLPSLAGVSQDEDFEMEERWRIEKYEREVFLKKMRENSKNDVEINEIPLLDENMKLNVTSTVIKDIEAEKRPVKEIPSPRKPLSVFQSNYRGSLLSRGGSSLSRLAALAAPLVESESSSVAAGSRNFVFAALSQSEKPKVPKRKATNEGTPRLIKKMKSEQNTLRNSLLDHLNP